MLTEVIQQTADWIAKNICSKIELKIPDDFRNDGSYKTKVVHPASFPLYVPGKDRLPPGIPAPVPSVCVQMVSGTDMLIDKIRTLDMRIVLACWNPGVHGNELYRPKGNIDALGGHSYFVDPDSAAFEKGTDGWKDNMVFQDLVLNTLEKAEYIAGHRIIKESGIKFGLFTEDGDICDYYPYWHSWISFQLEVGLTPKAPDYNQFL